MQAGDIELDDAVWFERVDVLVRLANLEESDGRASVALRHWRTVLELDPNHAEARTRIRAMTGGS